MIIINGLNYDDSETFDFLILFVLFSFWSGKGIEFKWDRIVFASQSIFRFPPFETRIVTFPALSRCPISTHSIPHPYGLPLTRFVWLAPFQTSLKDSSTRCLSSSSLSIEDESYIEGKFRHSLDRENENEQLFFYQSELTAGFFLRPGDEVEGEWANQTCKTNNSAKTGVKRISHLGVVHSEQQLQLPVAALPSSYPISTSLNA